ncbi:hypothetical protein ROR02_05120 [Pararhodospirillum oryzae]|uniref:Uncharacterized protein n=1 Tax=Pararhodospirillum oryzae TaxID=478448 RepID=A0A512H4M0_9PROT|nr:hypothetical protein ROR02_05120 [Pararhodospirillum oryzae]
MFLKNAIDDDLFAKAGPLLDPMALAGAVRAGAVPSPQTCNGAFLANNLPAPNPGAQAAGAWDGRGCPKNFAAVYSRGSRVTSGFCGCPQAGKGFRRRRGGPATPAEWGYGKK